MEVQQDISTKRLARLVGRDLDVLIDEAGDAGGPAVGRCYADAPEIDGAVRVSGGKNLRPGDMVQVRITGADEYDLTGDVTSRG